MAEPHAPTGNVFRWLAYLRERLMTHTAITSQLGRVPTSVPPYAVDGERALYTAHLSAIERPEYPCVTLYFPFHTDKTMRAVPIIGTLQVDVWVADQENAPVLPGKRGLWAIYAPLRMLLNGAHKRVENFSGNGWVCRYIVEESVDDTLWEPQYHLAHLAAKYEVVIRERGADIAMAAL